ncbi:GATA transcription factor 10-like isoform X1 [Asparagus officinalis]|uniref:GATA transcription factor 10-like isoform X1 n=1 Tax=Asparagus officinalis TaxID=4686 RepID=UPI00098E74AA|nr:GATA transcription factor 10-like isoform X1 [Asparagus officinalis]
MQRERSLRDNYADFQLALMDSANNMGSSSSPPSGLRSKGQKRKSTATDDSIAVERPHENEPGFFNTELDLSLSLGPPKAHTNIAQSTVDPGNNDVRAQAQNPAPRAPAVRICLECGTTNTTEWRRGPRGMKTLCNACGLRYWSQEKLVSTLFSSKHP